MNDRQRVWVASLLTAAAAAAVFALLGLGSGACTPAERQAIERSAPTEAQLAKAATCGKRIAQMCASDAGIPCSDGVKAAALVDCLRQPVVQSGGCAQSPGPYDDAAPCASDAGSKP